MRRVVRFLLASLLFLASSTLATPPHIPPSMIPVITQDDLCLAWVIDNEARGESMRGARAVYDVVKHRMEVRELTACEVVKQQGQFSGYKHGMRLTANALMLQRLTEVRRMRPVVPNADYFHSKDAKPSWAAKMKRILTVGLHVFYVKPKQKEKHK